MAAKNFKPHFSAIAAITIDGKIGKHDKHFSNWTSLEDKKFLRNKLDCCDVVIVGNNTYQTAKKPLSKRNCIVLTRKVKTISVENGNLVFLNPSKTNLKKFIQNLGYVNIVILGGAQTYQHCLEKSMLDDLYLTIEPLTFSDGINVFHAKSPRQRKWTLLSTRKLNKKGTLLLHYSLCRV